MLGHSRIASIAALLIGAGALQDTRLEVRYEPGRHVAHGPGGGVSPNYTRRGPGRRHRRSTKFNRPQQSRKYPIAQYGGNWQGVEYLSIVEHDTLTRLTRLGPTAELRALGFDGPISREQALAIITARRP